MGNLYFEIQKYKPASVSLGKALEALQVTHGSHCGLVLQLNDLWKKSMSISQAMSKGGVGVGVGGTCREKGGKKGKGKKKNKGKKGKKR